MTHRNAQTIKTNASNWTGDTATAELYAEGEELRLELNGYTYRLELHSTDLGDWKGRRWFSHSIKVFMERETEYPIACAVGDSLERDWAVGNGERLDAGVVISHRDPVVGIVKYLSNVV